MAAEYNAIIYEIYDFPAATGQIARRPLHDDMVLGNLARKSKSGAPQKKNIKKSCDLYRINSVLHNIGFFIQQTWISMFRDISSILQVYNTACGVLTLSSVTFWHGFVCGVFLFGKGLHSARIPTHFACAY